MQDLHYTMQANMPIHPHQPRPLEQAGPEGSKPEGHVTGSSKNHQSCL